MRRRLSRQQWRTKAPHETDFRPAFWGSVTFKAIKTEQVLVITKLIFNTNFSLEITSNVKNRFTHKLTTKRYFQTLSLFFSSTVTEWNAQDCGISKAAKDTSMLPSNSIREVGASGDRKIRTCLAAFRPWKSFRAQTIYLLASSNLFLSTLECGYVSWKKQHGVVPFHQHIKSLHGPIPLSGSSFNSVTLGSFDLYAV